MTWVVKRNAWPPCYLQPPMASGRYYPVASYLLTTLSVSLGNVIGGQIWVPMRTAFDRLACEVTNAGAAGTILRMGIYDSTRDGTWPDNLVLDPGAPLAGDSIGGKEHSISVTLPPGIYWLMLVHVGGTVAYRATTNGPISLWRSSDPTSLNVTQAGWGLQVVGGGDLVPSDGWPAKFFQPPSDNVVGHYAYRTGIYPRLMLRAA
jgi:hypothetical protein